MGPPGQPPARRPTQEALAKLADPDRQCISPNAPWYTSGVDFCFYAPAREACIRSRERLEKLKLQDDELKLLESSSRLDKIMEKLEEIQAAQERNAKRSAVVQQTSRFAQEFCAFADKTSNIVILLLPQSPEYSVTFGMLFLVFNAVVTKKEREESLVSYIHTISSQLPLMDFYNTVFPTNPMKASVARIYVQIMRLLDEALAYYRGGRLSKIVDAILHPNSKFDAYTSNVETEVRKMNALRDAGHVAQTADMMELVSEMGLLVARMYQNFESQSNAIGTSMEIVNAKLDTLTAQTNQFLHFEMVKHARALQDTLFSGGRDSEEELEIVLSRCYKLSQKDHWEINGVLNDLLSWSQKGRDILLWIGGTSGNQDSWVTELSADIIQALQPQLVTLLFVFCEQSGNERLTPLGVVRMLLVQLLDLHPELAYQDPEFCNLWRFQKTVTFRQAWRIFERLASKIHNLFVIVDRVEECEADEQADLVHQLLPCLIEFGERNGDASVIVTSIFDPPEEVMDMPIYTSYIDTSKRANRRGE